MNSLWLDVRYALRMMAKAPALTTVLILTLALGIGASTTIFSVVNSVLLRPLPFTQPDRLVRIYTEFHGEQPLLKFWMSTPEYDDVKQACRTCAAIASWSEGSAVIAGGDRPVRIRATYATASLAKVLGVTPMLGRWYDDREDLPGDPTVIVLGYDVWKRAFGGDPRVVGTKITLDAQPVTVLGVMAPGFDFLERQEAWIPLRIDLAKASRSNHGLGVVARLAPGESIASMRAELAALTAQLGKLDGPAVHMLRADHPLLAVPFQDDLVGSIAKTLWLLQGAVLFVLLISIVNIANLLLARSETRSREVAIRHALGASRRRLMRQFVTESVLLGLIGGGLGILATVWAVDAIASLIPESAPRASQISVDTSVVLFAIACSVGAALLFGIAPIIHARKTDVHTALKDGSNRMTGSKARLRVRRALVIAEIVLAVVLVIGCTVMVRSFIRLQRVELGFQPDHLLTFGIQLPAKTYPNATPDVFWHRAEAALQKLPGVTSVALVDGLPPQRRFLANSFSIVGETPPTRGQLPWTVDHWQLLNDRALDTLGARIVHGRGLLPSDTFEAPQVVVVNQAFATRFFAGKDPVGRKLRLTGGGNDDGAEPQQTIVGVVADLKSMGVDKPAGTEVFIPLWQYAAVTASSRRPPRADDVVFFALRTVGDPLALVPSVQKTIADLDPSLPLSQVRSMNDVMWEAVARPRFLAVLLTSFAVLALLLAAVGIYGVMAHTVAQRTHEIGLRVALGAQPRQVRAMVIRQAATLVGIGVVIGVVLAVILEQVLGSSLNTLFYGEHLAQPALLAAVAVAVSLSALIATWIPVRRATRVQPTVALRSE